MNWSSNSGFGSFTQPTASFSSSDPFKSSFFTSNKDPFDTPFFRDKKDPFDTSFFKDKRDPFDSPFFKEKHDPFKSDFFKSRGNSNAYQFISRSNESLSIPPTSNVRPSLQSSNAEATNNTSQLQHDQKTSRSLRDVTSVEFDFKGGLCQAIQIIANDMKLTTDRTSAPEPSAPLEDIDENSEKKIRSIMGESCTLYGSNVLEETPEPGYKIKDQIALSDAAANALDSNELTNSLSKPSDNISNATESEKNNEAQKTIKITVKRDLNDEKTCKICMEANVECVFDDCGHMIACIQSSKNFTNCPFCRKKIIKTIKFYA